MSKLDLSIIIKFVDKATQPIRQFQQNVQSTNQSLDRLTHSIDRLERSLNGGRSFQQYSRNLKVGTTNINQNNSAVNTIHGGYDRVATVLDKVRNKTQEWTDTLKANRAEMRQEFKALAVNSVVAGAGLYKFFQPAIDFEKQMSGVQSVLDLEKQSAAMKQLTADARKWGAASSFSPGEAAQAQFALGSGGFNADQIHKALGGTLQLAEAGKVELERAAQIAVGTLNGFGLAADKINHVNDVFLKGTNLTATSVDGLGETMKYVAPIAKAYGVSIEQATAMTGLLGNNNILDTQAGTSLRSIMTRFAGPPKEAAKAFDKLKIKTVDAKGNMRDIADILADVNKATKNLGTGQRLDIFKDIAGQEAVSAFAVLVDESVKLDTTTGKTVNNIKLMTKELENSEGAAARAAAILKDNLAGDIEQLGGSIQDLSISLLNVVGTDIRTFVSGLGNFIDKIKVWVDANPQLVKTIANLVLKLLMFKVAMLGVRYTSNLLFGTIFSMIAGITKFTLIMWVATKALDKFGIGMPSRLSLISTGARLLGRAFIFLSKQALPLIVTGLRMLAVGLLTNPLTIFIAGIATAALLVYTYWAPIKAFFTGFWEGLTSGFSATKLIISDFFTSIAPVIEPLKPAWNWLTDKFTIFKGILGEIFKPFEATNDQLKAANTYGQTFGTWVAIVTSALLAMKIALAGVAAIQGLVTFFSTFTVSLSSAAVAAWSFLAPFLPIILAITLLSTAAYLIYKNWTPIKAFFSDLWIGIKSAFNTGVNFVKGIIQGIDSIFANNPILNILIPFIGIPRMIITNWSSITAFFSEVWASITTGASNLWTSITTFFSPIGQWFSEKWDQIKQSAADAWSHVIGYVYTAWEKIKQSAADAWSRVIGYVYTAWEKLKEIIANNPLLQRIINGWENIFSYLGTLKDKMLGIGKNIVQGLIDGISWGFDKLKGVWEKINNYMPDFMRKRMDIHSPSRVMAGMGGHIVDGIGVGLNQRTPALQTQFNRTLGVFDASPAMPSTPTLKRRFIDSVGITETPVSSSTQFDNSSQTAPKFKRVAAINSPRSISVTNSDNITIHINAGGGGPIHNAANQVRQALAERDRQRNADLRRMLTDRE